MSMQQSKTLLERKATKDNTIEYFISKQLLGEGGFGKVYRGEMITRPNKQNNELGIIRKEVAIKTMKWRHYQKDIKPLQDYAKLSIARDSQLLKKMKHLHIIKIIQHIEKEDKVYFVMPLCQKHSLNEILAAKELSLKKIFEYAKVIVDVLNYVHYIYPKQAGLSDDQFLVHRDLKPSNILFQQTEINAKSRQYERILVIADFGCARVIDAGKKNDFTITGTPRYQAPELISPNKAYKQKNSRLYTLYDSKVDVWAFGITLMMMFGQRPFQKQLGQRTTIARAQRRISGTIESEFRPNIKKKYALNQEDQKFWFQKVIKPCLMYRPEKRITSKELLSVFESRQQFNKQSNSQVPKQMKVKALDPNFFLQTSKISWYDVHVAQNKIMLAILRLKDISQKLICKWTHIQVVIFLCLCQYEASYNVELIQENYEKKELEKRFNDVMFRHGISQLEDCRKNVQEMLGQSYNSVILRMIPSLKDLQNLPKKASKIRQLLRAYLQIFGEQMRLCQITKSYMLLFWLVAQKSILIRNNNLHPQLSNCEDTIERVENIRNQELDKRDFEREYSDYLVMKDVDKTSAYQTKSERIVPQRKKIKLMIQKLQDERELQKFWKGRNSIN